MFNESMTTLEQEVKGTVLREKPRSQGRQTEVIQVDTYMQAHRWVMETRLIQLFTWIFLEDPVDYWLNLINFWHWMHLTWYACNLQICSYKSTSMKPSYYFHTPGLQEELLLFSALDICFLCLYGSYTNAGRQNRVMAIQTTLISRLSTSQTTAISL